jgi:GTP-binding protein
MRIKRAEITAVCAKQNQYPADDRQEIAFAGRSNVGKSSLINLLTGRKKLAKISGSPGKTRTINFYEITTDIDIPFRIVDLPGYGYAKVSKSMSADWGRMMEEYFTVREGLRRVILLVDIRHEPTKQDVQMYDYLKYYGLDGTVVATKADKVSRNQLAKQKKLIRKTLGMDAEDDIICVSALKKTGQDELLDVMQALLESAVPAGDDEGEE